MSPGKGRQGETVYGLELKITTGIKVGCEGNYGIFMLQGYQWCCNGSNMCDDGNYVEIKEKCFKYIVSHVITDIN